MPCFGLYRITEYRKEGDPCFVDGNPTRFRSINIDNETFRQEILFAIPPSAQVSTYAFHALHITVARPCLADKKI